MFWVVAATSTLASSTRADSAEYFAGVVLHPSDPNVFALRYESGLGGLVLTRDGGRSAQLVPGRAVHDYGLRGRTPLAFVADGKLLLALDSGLDIDDGKGCFPPPPGPGEHHSEPAVEGLVVIDVVTHPSDPAASFLVTRADIEPGHAGIWRRDKQGTLTPLGKSEPTAMSLDKIAFSVTDLTVVARAASMEGVRFLLAGTENNLTVMPASSRPVLRVSDDLGATWTSHTVPDPGATRGNPFILLVDASEPFKALVALENPGTREEDPIDPVFVTRNGGQSFELYSDKLQAAQDALLLPDGELLLGDRGVNGGLWLAANFDTPPARISDQTVGCLAYQASTQKILTCRSWEVGYLDLASKSFCAMFRMREASSFPACPAAPLTQNKKGIEQLCDAFCGPNHYPSAPVCSSFPVPTGAVCGPAAYAYDHSDPDPNKHAIELPGSNAAPRCAGFSEPPDAGVGPDADAGTPPNTGNTPDAATAPEGGGLQRTDAQAAEPNAVDEADGAIEREDDPPTTRKADGCGCRLAEEAPRAGGLGTWIAAALTGLLVARRGRRAMLGVTQRQPNGNSLDS